MSLISAGSISLDSTFKHFLLLSNWAYLLSCQLGYEGSQYTFTCHTERRKTKKELGKVLIAWEYRVSLVPKRKHLNTKCGPFQYNSNTKGREIKLFQNLALLGEIIL
jgi:hypothetical protein